MITKQPTRTLAFEEKDEELVSKLAADIGCYYSKANDRTYNLNQFDAAGQRERGVFAWVHKKEKNCLWVSTRIAWVEQARTMVMVGRNKSGLNCFPKQDRHAEDSLSLDIREDYDKSVRLLTLINKAVNG
jgi:hypothetical protein